MKKWQTTNSQDNLLSSFRKLVSFIWASFLYVEYKKGEIDMQCQVPHYTPHAFEESGSCNDLPYGDLRWTNHGPPYHRRQPAMHVHL